MQKLASWVFDPAFHPCVSSGDFLFAPSWPIEKVILEEDLLCLSSESETSEGIAKEKFFARAGSFCRDPGSKAQFAIH